MYCAGVTEGAATAATAEPAVRTVQVASPSVMKETGRVLLACFHIVLWSSALMYATAGSADDAGRPKTIVTYDQVSAQSLPAADQRMYRACLEGLTEAENIRARTQDWPTVEALAARGIPPFAPDPIDQAGYSWKQLRSGVVINYVGTPTAASRDGQARPTLVIIAVEPDPGTPVDPQAPTDETHYKLRDGTMLHVSIWTGTRPVTAALSTPAFEDGWRQITRVTH